MVREKGIPFCRLTPPPGPTVHPRRDPPAPGSTGVPPKELGGFSVYLRLGLVALEICVFSPPRGLCFSACLFGGLFIRVSAALPRGRWISVRLPGFRRVHLSGVFPVSLGGLCAGCFRLVRYPACYRLTVLLLPISFFLLLFWCCHITD